MNYICEVCGFFFCRMGEVNECPSCERNQIRSVTEEETQRLQELPDSKSER
jgi:rubrerythrin